MEEPKIVMSIKISTLFGIGVGLDRLYGCNKLDTQK
jgi:hypothetical protein